MLDRASFFVPLMLYAVTMTDMPTNYRDFWPYYLREHAQPWTRNMHYIGTGLVIAIAIYAIATQAWTLLWIVPVAGYFFAWISHALIERNKPATFSYPVWSLISDFRMFFLWALGRLGPELTKAGVER